MFDSGTWCDGMDPRQFLAMEVWNVSLIYLVERMGRSMFFLFDRRDEGEWVGWRIWHRYALW